MQLVLEKRAERSNTIALVSPLIAIGLTIVTMVILFAILGKNPALAAYGDRGRHPREARPVDGRKQSGAEGSAACS